ncbi:MAG: hypothetical protein Q8Q41_00895 [bacterium]|nr:hypothetical protein [bacterium]
MTTVSVPSGVPPKAVTTVPSVQSPVSSPGTRNFLGTRVAVVLIAILALIGISIALMPSGLFDSRPSTQAARAPKPPVCPGAKDVAVTAKETAVEIRSHCLTGTILLPIGNDFVVDAPGELEYFFWNGQRFLVQDKEAKWLGQAPYSTFRLRGTSGQAKLTLTKQ